MQKEPGKAYRSLRWGVFSLAAAIALVSVTADPADAVMRRKSTSKASASSYSPPYADIVVDANTGAVLHSTNPDAQRHPASLTKIMTLYMLFEQLEAGKISLKTALPVSARAASQAPSKLGVKPGETITVEDAIRAIVTRSANDVAVVIAEALGGDEDNFCRLMTARAHSLGMQKTVYRNASGLPDDAQITTARDQALLGRIIQERFPKYYGYFSITRFSYRGKSIANHNRLLGKVEGVDGIKTGYTNASGFNLVTSMRRGGRHVVAVVLGGRSGASRDDKMRGLVNEYVRVASVQRTAPALAEAAPPEAKPGVAQRLAAAVITPARAEIPPSTGAIPLPRPAPAAAQPIATAPQAAPQPASATKVAAAAAPGSADPLEPISIKTISVRAGGQQNVALAAPATTASVTPSAPQKGPEMAFADPAQDRQPGVLGTLTVKATPAVSPAPAKELQTELVRPPARPGWVIQVGAFDREDEARTRLSTAQARARSVLGGADGFTERVVKGDKTLYRARFAGLGKEQAEAACQQLKKNEIACMALKN
jgi:D-alanyl-D-alanine carboxypeptidase